MRKWRAMIFCVVSSLILMVSTIIPNQSFAETSHKELIQEIVSLAEEGKVLNCSFGVGSNKDDVIKKLGKPDGEVNHENEGYITYTNKGLEFNYLIDNNGNPENEGYIYGITKTSKVIRKLTYKELKKEIKDLEFETFPGIGRVEIGNYELVLFFEEKPEDSKNPHLNHMRVYLN